MEEKMTIEKPATAETSSVEGEFVIHAMPKEFLGKVLEKKPELEVKKVAEKPKSKPLPPPPPPKPKAVITPECKPKKSSKLVISLLVLIIFLISAGAVATVYLLQSEPEVEPLPDMPPIEQPESDPESTGPEPGIDTDSDGLTDMEERLYGTDHRNPDTDNDSFLDGNEVFHRFDPLSPSPSTLLDTGSVDIYEYENGVSFSMYYPASWKATPEIDDAGKGTGVQFDSPGATVISVDIMEKSIEDTFEAWLEKKNFGFDALTTPPPGQDSLDIPTLSDFVKGETKEGHESYASKDQRTVYVLSDTEVYVFEYDLGSASTIQYLQTFQMMVNSFKLTGLEEQPNS